MNSRSTLRIALILLGVAACAALAWLFLREYAGTGAAGDLSYALISAPADGDIILLGDPTYVKAIAFLSKRDLGQSQLVVDGSPYSGEEGSPSGQLPTDCSAGSSEVCGGVDSTILWRSTTAGKHLLALCLFGNVNSAEQGQVCTDPITVTVVDPYALPVDGGSYSATAGDTVQSVAEKFGLPPVIVAAANPDVDPASPLAPGTPIHIPALPLDDSAPAGDSASSTRAFVSVHMTVDLPVDKVYCYYSLGGDYWSRVPAAAQSFAYPLSGQLDLTANFRSVTLPADSGFLAMECWGWSGNTLTELGSGQSILPAETDAQLSGDHFKINGSLAPAPAPLANPMGGTPPPTPPPGAKLMPPIKVRRTGNLDDCINHFPDVVREFLGTLFCKGAVEKSQFILIWDRALFPLEGFTTEIQGYKVYKTNSSGVLTLIKTISDPGQQVLILTPDVITSPPPTFCVRTYFGTLLSTPTCYVAVPETMGLATVKIPAVPASVNALSHFVDWESKLIHDCSGSGGLSSDADPQFIVRPADQILVGYFHRSEDCVELDDTYYRGSVLFDLSKIAGPLSTATLSYTQGKTVSEAPGMFGTGGQSCAASLNIGTDLSTGGITAFDPYRALPGTGFVGLIHKVDVTEAVRGWMLGERNLGFVLTGRDETFPEENDVCWSFYGAFTLTATYFTPSK